MKKSFLFLFVLFFGIAVSAQVKPRKDKAVFKEYKPGYYQNSILKGIEEYETKVEIPATTKRFKVDLSGIEVPTSVEQFTRYWSQPPISQGNTSTCWCYSTTSFFESEIYRLYKKEIKLSEMYTVYWEYVEKAQEFVRTRGVSLFGEGSEANAVTRIWKTYGVVPESAYNGMKEGQIVQNHSKMFEEMESYLKSVKAASAWNETDVLSTIKAIMNTYMGAPPTMVTVDGKTMSPQDYLKNSARINVDDYCDVTSIMEKPYYTKVEYDVPDNWWNNADYINIPLDEYMTILKNAIKKGYTVSLGGDVSEAGFESYVQVAVVPTFDIPSEYIDENARQFRFSNQTTTDDHGMHLVGYYEKDGVIWFLLKDSGAGSRNGGKENKNFGYYFFHEDYVKLKMMDYMIHKDMLKDILPKITK